MGLSIIGNTFADVVYNVRKSIAYYGKPSNKTRLNFILCRYPLLYKEFKVGVLVKIAEKCCLFK